MTGGMGCEVKGGMGCEVEVDVEDEGWDITATLFRHSFEVRTSIYLSIGEKRK